MSLRELYDRIARTPSLSPQKVGQLMKAGLTVEQIAHRHANPKNPSAKARFYTPGCEHYPVRLTDLDDPPLRLFHRGQPISTLSRPIVGVVGSRKASSFGRGWAHRLGVALTRSGASVCSGLAMGIDGAVHEGAIEQLKRNPEGAAPVAVLGHGWNFMHPKEHRQLAKEILERGCLLTEYDPHQPPGRWTFPARNRIIAGLCDHLVVVEASVRSGSLHTAKFASDIGRQVWAVPNVPGRINSGGVLELIRGGAKLLYNMDEFVETVCPKRKFSDQPELPKLSTRNLMLLGLLHQYDGQVEPLFEELNWAPVELAYQLTELEIEGLVRRTLDGRWEILAWDLLENLLQQVTDERTGNELSVLGISE